MDKTTLLKKLDAMFDEIARARTWANVEIEFRDGVANMIRTTKNEKLIAQENTRGPRYESR
ncbi:MAG TPA: hypothetical protein VEJ46_14055 [Candidatus Acidoferrum sp.]|nr:hypothetical protein [Candidatus Acidoferrum sp.]